MRCRFPSAVALVALCGGATLMSGVAQDKREPAKKELDALEGTWTFVSLVEDGVRPRRKKDDDARTATFQGDKFELKKGDKVVRAGTHAFDPSKDPKVMNLTVTEGDGKGTVELGIFELDGDTLKLCLDPEGKKRPTEFRSTPESGFTMAILQRGRIPGPDSKDASVFYDDIHPMNSGFLIYNGKVYDMAALSVGPKTKIVVPDRLTVVEKHDQDDVVLIHMEKNVHMGFHVRHNVSVKDYRDKLGCAVKLEKGDLLIGTFGEFGFLEGSVSMRLLVTVPTKVEVERRAGLIGGYGGRAGSDRPPAAINPTRDEPKPALTKSKEGKPPRWLPPTEADGWHEIPTVPDVDRRASSVEKEKERPKK